MKNKEAFIKTVLSGKALTIKQYVYGILLKNQGIKKEDLFNLCSTSKKEFSKAFRELLYDGLIRIHCYVYLEALNDIVFIQYEHDYQRILKFEKDKNRFIKNHKDFIPDHLLTKLKSI